MKTPTIKLSEHPRGISLGLYFIQLPAWVFHGRMRVWFKHTSVHDHFMSDSHWWPGDLPEPDFDPTKEDVEQAYKEMPSMFDKVPKRRIRAENFSKTVKNPKPEKPISLVHPGYV